MPKTNFEPVAVVGVGLMGTGIAQAFAAAGHEVSLFDANPAVAASAPTRIEYSLRELQQNPLEGRRLRVCAGLHEAVREVAVVFECGPERLDVKRQVFAELQEYTPPSTVLASNTSVIPIGRISEGMASADRILGTHWWNPAHLIPLVEVVPTPRTHPDHVTTTMNLLTRIGKSPIRLTQDIPGFVGNRLQFALWREAQALVAAGVCDAETLDNIVKTSFGPRLAVLGPMENADLIGLDLALDILRVVSPDLCREREPNSALEELVKRGQLGFKTGSGFRQWTQGSIEACRHRLLTHLKAAFSSGSRSE